MTIRTRQLVCFSILCLIYAWPAAAQEEPRLQVSGGYLFLRIQRTPQPEPAPGQIPRGWTADVVTSVSRHVEIAGNVSGSYWSEVQTFSEPIAPGVNATARLEARIRLHGFAAGPRFVAGRGPVRVYGQMLAGAVRASTLLQASVTANGQTQPLDDESNTLYRVSIQPGGGVIVPVTKRFGAQAGVDYRRILFDKNESEGDNELRLSAGIVVTILR